MAVKVIDAPYPHEIVIAVAVTDHLLEQLGLAAVADERVDGLPTGRARLVEVARARRMLLLGEKIDGATAADWGLIHQAVGPDNLPGAAEDLLARLATGPTVALGLAKRAIAYGQHATLGQSMAHELSDLELSARSADFKEGLAAFRDRRAPDFQGR